MFLWSAGTLVHDGFQETQGRTADTVLSTVKSALSSTGYTRVLVTGKELRCRLNTTKVIMTV